MKQRLLFCTMTFQLLLVFTGLKAQNFSVTGSLGLSNYRGDLATDYVPTFGGAFSLGATYDVAPKWRVRLNLSSLSVQGDDALSKGKGISDRNLNFKTNISELALLGEYDLLDAEFNRLIPYVFGGAAVYHFNPQALHAISGSINSNGYTAYTSGDVDLHNLGTEGQFITGIKGVKGNYTDKSYNLTQFNVQVGAGLRYDISDDVSLGFEVNLRKLFTDYLDDASGPHYVTPSDWKAAEDYYSSLGAAGKSMLDKTLIAEAYAFRGIVGNKFSNTNATGWLRGNSNKDDAFYSFQLRMSFRINSIGGPDWTLFSSEHTNGRKQLRCAGNVY